MLNNRGFTLIELMFVVSIIGILAAIAIPNFGVYKERAYVSEGLLLSRPIKADVIEYYDYTGKMPAKNSQCGQPKSEHIKGKYVDSININNGIITITYNDSFNGKCNKGNLILTPIINNEYPTGPVTWEKSGCAS